MHPLPRQYQFVSDSSKLAVARLAGIDAPVFEDTETTFAQLQARCDKTIAFIESVDRAAFEGAESREVVIKFPDGRGYRFSGADYLKQFRAAEFLFPRHDRLRDPAGAGRVDGQARFPPASRHAGAAVIQPSSSPRKRGTSGDVGTGVPRFRGNDDKGNYAPARARDPLFGPAAWRDGGDRAAADRGARAGRRLCRRGRGRQLRPVVIPGNLVEVDLRSKSDSQLPFAKLELVESRGPWLGEPLPAAAIGWVCALTATALPERQAYPTLYQALDRPARCDLPCALGARLGGGAGRATRRWCCANSAMAAADGPRGPSSRMLSPRWMHFRRRSNATSLPTGAAMLWRARDSAGQIGADAEMKIAVLAGDGIGPEIMERGACRARGAAPARRRRCGTAMSAASGYQQPRPPAAARNAGDGQGRRRDAVRRGRRSVLRRARAPPAPRAGDPRPAPGARACSPTSAPRRCSPGSRTSARCGPKSPARSIC